MYEFVKGIAGFAAGLGGSMIANQAIGRVFVPTNKFQVVCGYVAKVGLASAVGGVAEDGINKYLDKIKGFYDTIKDGVSINLNTTTTDDKSSEEAEQFEVDDTVEVQIDG